MANAISRSGNRPSRVYTFTWLSDADGDVNEPSTVKTDPMRGHIVRVDFMPNTGTTQPTSLYDVTLLDENGLDLLQGQGADLSNSANSSVVPGISITDGTTTGVREVIVDGTMELRVANAGAAKTGTVIVYMD